MFFEKIITNAFASEKGVIAEFFAAASIGWVP